MTPEEILKDIDDVLDQCEFGEDYIWHNCHTKYWKERKLWLVSFDGNYREFGDHKGAMLWLSALWMKASHREEIARHEVQLAE